MAQNNVKSNAAFKTATAAYSSTINGILEQYPADAAERIENGLNNNKAITDLVRILPIIEKQSTGIELNESDFIALVQVLNHGISYHNSGKIAGIQSLDSTATAAFFCIAMRKAAKADNSIICGLCYDFKQESYRTNILGRHFINMLILKSFDIPASYFKVLEITTSIFRFNSSGDIENQTHAENLVKIANAFPAVNFGLWSKNVPAVNGAFKKYGKPENMRYIQSVCRINAENFYKSEWADTYFKVCTADKIKIELAAGCNACNGKKCHECGWKCYLKAANGGWNAGTTTAELLRT